jgi:methanogenic corrinoid protein MtbC1
MSMHSAAATLVEQKAHSIADWACNHLLNAHTELRTKFGSDAQEIWSDHLQQRLLELSAALAANDHQLFLSRLAWSRSAMQARGLSSEDLDSSLASLRAGLAENLQGEALAAAIEYLDLATKALDKATATKLDPILDAGIACDKLALQYVQTVVAGNVIPGVQLILDEVAHGLSISDAYLRVLLPAQHEVGRLWHLNELSVSEEHLVSYTTQRIMAVLANIAPRKPDNGFTAVAGAVAGNVHDIGIRAIAYLLEIEGWRTIYLGSDIPQVEVPATIDTYAADVLLLSVALTSQIHATKHTISEIRENSTRQVKVLVGGNGLAERAGLWKELGADGYAPSAQEALVLAYEFANRGTS